ncbi:hypothetical protein BDW62DRAFT_202197 [Aspergillus aurantiobrunneus]
MDPTSHATSKRPPKLRSACNECHAAKVRCSGEKTGCQRCSNLRLKCAFSISRIGKVPGKRSKANRVASMSTSSAPISTSSSSMSTPMMSPPLATTTRPSESSRAYSGRAPIPISTTSYPFAQDYAAGTLPLASEATYAHSPPGYPPNSNPEELTGLNNLCWSTELDQLSGPGLLSPDWEIDADDSIPLTSPPAAPTTTHQTLSSHEPISSNGYASPTEPFPSAQYTMYLQLLHSIDHTIQFSHQCRSSPGSGSEGMPSSTLDSILVASQRYLTTLLQITDTPVFTHTYNEEHLLVSVALERMIDLFGLGYTEFQHRVGVYGSMGVSCLTPVDWWARNGGLEVDVVDRVAAARGVFVDEVKRARLCLGRLMEAMGCLAGSRVAGRHEGLCEEMKRRLDALVEDLEDQSGRGGRLG